MKTNLKKKFNVQTYILLYIDKDCDLLHHILVLSTGSTPHYKQKQLSWLEAKSGHVPRCGLNAKIVYRKVTLTLTLWLC